MDMNLTLFGSNNYKLNKASISVIKVPVKVKIKASKIKASISVIKVTIV